MCGCRLPGFRCGPERAPKGSLKGSANHDLRNTAVGTYAYYCHREKQCHSWSSTGRSQARDASFTVRRASTAIRTSPGDRDAYFIIIIQSNSYMYYFRNLLPHPSEDPFSRRGRFAARALGFHTASTLTTRNRLQQQTLALVAQVAPQRLFDQ
jgi:hypothetical protein